MPEIDTGANQRGSLPHNRVPSVAMSKYKNLFRIHDHKTFLNYLENVKKGKDKIAAGALLPHDIIGFMEGTPMKVYVALGLLTSELSEEPWKDFEVAADGKKLDQDQRCRIFAFSDMYFDQAPRTFHTNRSYSHFWFDRDERQRAEERRRRGWETDYEMIVRKFKENGFLQVPEIVFRTLDTQRVVLISQQVDDTDDSFNLFSEDQLFDDQIETDIALHAKLDGIMYKKGKRKT
ncbi:hypothetical protein Cgig2_010545 [Carnegiea gigantea]|uniref:Uncharacterized protein n=1 Tax=Carnegiea gigantea TaxID=171969 RepID=A0A9Q1KSA3_9CARY|nr:hypothetical protein Cgig2_010545 [Carnegiea gigantea]